MSLFPVMQPVTSDEAADRELPMAVEPAWDFETDRPIFRGGELQKVTGAEAVKVWAVNALLTVRRRWACLSPNYGNDMEALVGSAYSEALITAEATRYVRECLTASPYITDVKIDGVSFSDGRLSIDSIAITSIYGEVVVSV